MIYNIIEIIESTINQCSDNEDFDMLLYSR